MKVKFQNNFHVPGFPRSRFVKGVCEVPESMRNSLPRTAVILPDDYKEPETLAQELDQRRASDFGRAAAESSGREALEKAGMAGYSDVAVNEADARANEASARADKAVVRADAAEEVQKATEAKLAELIATIAANEVAPDEIEADIEADASAPDEKPAKASRRSGSKK